MPTSSSGVATVRPWGPRASVLDFDPGTHTYRQDGRIIPGVTETIKPLAPDFDRFPSYEARERGKLVHALTAVMDGRGDLWPEMPEGKEDELSGYCDAWHKFKCESKAEIFADHIEKQIYHQLYCYAGTIDRFVSLPRWRQPQLQAPRYVLDIKTGSYDSSHQLQLAAYLFALSYGSEGLAFHSGAMAVYLRANGTYTTRSYTSKELQGPFTTFLALRSVAEWKKEHGPATEPDVIDDWVPLKDDEVFVL